jgi:twitching motility protein PilI
MFTAHRADAASAIPLGENREASRLGMQLGEQNWLLELADVIEVMPPPKLMRVPFTKAWFAGVACLHGNVVGVVDFAAFLGSPLLEQQETARLVLLAERSRCHSALLFSRALGLQPCDRFEREPDAARPAWTAGSYRDAEGERWSMLDLEGLLSHPDFLSIEAAE